MIVMKLGILWLKDTSKIGVNESDVCYIGYITFVQDILDGFIVI